MHSSPAKPRSGFTLIETVIAIGVVVLLLSGLLIVFAPTAASIKDSITSKAANRLVKTLEQELVSLRGQSQLDEFSTGFDKAFEFIKDSSGADSEKAVLVYKYRASLTQKRASDGTPAPINNVQDLVAGKDFVVRNMMRRKSDPEFAEDIPAIDGPVYVVKCTQLILDDVGQMTLGNVGQIINEDEPDIALDNSEDYEHAVLAFAADFYRLPSRGQSFFDSQFVEIFPDLKRVAFSRNLAVRR